MAHVITNDTWQVGVLPQAGGSLAYARIKRDGVWHDFMRPTPIADCGDALKCASYLLTPWSNRLRDARFAFAGTTYQLNPSFPDGTAIHGVGRSFAWRVVSSDDTHIELHFDTRLHSGVNFPFAFKAWVEYRLDGANFSTRMGLTNLDSQPLPAGFGTHPFIQRTLTGSDDLLSLQIPCDSAYPLADCMPTGVPQPIPAHLDFRQLRQVGTDFADDCLTGRQIGESIVLQYGASDTHITHWMDHLYSHVVLYMPKEQPYIALEPVSNANDGFNLLAQGADGHGVFVLAPGCSREAMSGYMVGE